MCLDRSFVHEVEKRIFYRNANRGNHCDVLYELESYVGVKNKHFFMITILHTGMCVREPSVPLLHRVMNISNDEPYSKIY